MRVQELNVFPDSGNDALRSFEQSRVRYQEGATPGLQYERGKAFRAHFFHQITGLLEFSIHRDPGSDIVEPVEKLLGRDGERLHERNVGGPIRQILSFDETGILGSVQEVE